MRDIREKGWFWIENELIDRTDLNAYEKLLYMTLARYCDTNGKSFPSMELLMRVSGIGSKKTLIKHLKSLEEKEFIKITKQNGKGNIYYLKNVKKVEKKESETSSKSDTSSKNDTGSKSATPPVAKWVPDQWQNGYTKETQYKNIIKNTQYIPPLYFPQPKNEIENYINELEKENEYKDLVVEFVKYRKKIGHSFKTKTGLKTLVKEFETVEELREAVEIAMENEWRGVKKAWVLNYKKSLQAKEIETKDNKFKGVTPESIKKLIGGLT